MQPVCRQLIIVGLVAVSLTATVGIIALGLSGSAIPPSLPLIASTALGALAGALTLAPPRP